MRSIKKALAISSLLALSAPAFAGFVLDFEGVGNLQKVGGLYDSAAYGHTEFSESGVLGLIDTDAGGAGNFSNAPSKWTVLLMTSSFEIEVEDGFNSLFAVFYTHNSNPAGAEISISDADHKEIGKTSLANVSGNCMADEGDNDTGVSCWGMASISFSGTARYLSFTSEGGGYIFDNMQFGSSGNTPPASTVPEPTDAALGLAALGALALSRRRR